MKPALIYIDNYMLTHVNDFADTALKRGLFTILISDDPDYIAHKSLEKHVILERLDYKSLMQAMSILQKDYEVLGIRTTFGLCKDGVWLSSTVADIRQDMLLPGSSRESLEKCNNKFLMRKALNESGLGKVNFTLIKSAQEAEDAVSKFSETIILKPICGVGAAFIQKCETREQASENYNIFRQNVTRSRYEPLACPEYVSQNSDGDLIFRPQEELLAETYIKGAELSVECLVIGREVYPLVVNDKIEITEDRYTVYEDILITPSQRFTRDEINEIKTYAEKCVRVLGLSDCFCHVELRYNKEDGAVILEVNPRIGAGCVRDSLMTFWGIDQIAAEISLSLGEVPEISRFERTNRPHAMFFLYAKTPGVLKKIMNLETILHRPGVLAVRPMAEIGTVLGNGFEEDFIVGVWKRLEEEESPRDFYRDINKIVEIEIEDVI